jgi:P27 family predicted phage terminase small subunit
MRGSWRANSNKGEPKPPAGRPTCPSWLDKEAKAAWKALVPMMVVTGLLTRIDRNALARYCQYYARWKRAEQFIQQYGSTYPIKDERGQVKCFALFPEVAIASKLGQQLTRLEQEFGLTPSSRSRISIDVKTTQESERDRMLRKKFFGGA